MRRRSRILLGSCVVLGLAAASAFELGDEIRETVSLQPCVNDLGASGGSASAACVTPDMLARSVNYGLLSRLGY